MKALRHLLVLLVSITPLFYLAISWEALPAQVPTHFDAEGNPNGYTPKDDLWGVIGLFSALAFGCYALILNLHKIDPKRKDKLPGISMVRMSVIMAIFLSGMGLIILISAVHPEWQLTKNYITVLVGIFLAIIGNYMHNIKPNYFVGIKIPWTLANEYNWKKTHELASWLWVTCGITMALSALLLPVSWQEPIVLLLIGTIIIVPTAYSFRLYKRMSSDSGLP